MKKIRNYLMLVLLATGMFACSSDDEGDDALISNADNVYMAFRVSMPQTRSTTDKDGNSTDKTIEGTEDENVVGEVQMVLVDSDGKPFAYSTETFADIKGGKKNQYTAVFDSRDILGQAGKECSVYISCNGSILGSVGQDNANIATLDESIMSISNYPESEVWEVKHFLMTNANSASKLTLNKDDIVKSTKDEPLPIGTIQVERAAVRFDYEPVKTNNQYKLVAQTNTPGGVTTEKVENGIIIELNSSAVVNVSKNFYTLRRVSADGTNKDQVVGGKEVSETPYVVDTDCDLKKNTKTNLESVLKGNFFNFFNIKKDYAGIKKLPLTTGESSTIHYTTENTLAQGVKQLEGNTTGIMFKGKLIADKPSDSSTDKFKELHKAMDEKKNLYVYKNHIYGSWEMIGKYLSDDKNKGDDNFDNLFIAYTYVTKAMTDYNNKHAGATISEPSLTMAKAEKFTVFTYNTDEKAYNVYYYYWNKHNDAFSSSDALEDRHMEYATVRNNVYRLKVNNIYNFGHPENSEGDPDPGNPDTPINPEDTYFSVTVEVLPWTLRINDIDL